MPLKKLIDFEPYRNEWYMRMRIEGKVQAVYLGVHFEDRVGEAMKKCEDLLSTLCATSCEEEAIPMGLLHTGAVANFHGEQQDGIHECFNPDNYTF